MPGVLALHGFAGGGADFSPLAEALPELSWHAPDLPGHAPDPTARGAPTDACDLPSALGFLASLPPPAKDAKEILLGYSMGGRLALRYALARPGRFAALVLVGTSAGLADAAERAARRDADEKLAEEILARGVPAFLEKWRRQPLIATQERLPHAWREAMLARRQQLRAEGLAASLRSFGQGAVEPVHELLGQLRLPVLFCAGAEDQKYSALAQNMQARCPNSECFIVPGAGHMAHLENRDVFGAGLRAFLTRLA